MIKKYRKKICAGIYFLAFLSIGFFYLFINKVSAQGLEINYPPITVNGVTETIGAGIKLPAYIKYLFDLGMFVGFLAVFISLIIAGIMYFLSPINSEFLTSAKDRVSGAISGLLILVLTYLIVATINPQLKFLSSNELSPTTPPPTTQAEGVYFYKELDCADTGPVQDNISSLFDLGSLKEKVKSVRVVQNPDNQTFYITILYGNPELWGKCQYITTTAEAQTNICKNTTPPFASSASIYAYDFNPNGDGVYFYRKACFNNYAYSDAGSVIAQCNTTSGGYYEVTNEMIKSAGVYMHKLDDPSDPLEFTGVPEAEQDCIKYDKNGECCTEKDPDSGPVLGCDEDGRKIPIVGGENTSSMIINGNYIVLLVYKSKDDDISGPWTSCEEFPIPSDANGMGPRQIKWENIRNNNGVIPNYVIIIPVQKYNYF